MAAAVVTLTGGCPELGERTTSEAGGTPKRDPAYRIGETFAEKSVTVADAPHTGAAIDDVLRSSVTTLNQHIMGWGAENPEPKPGVYDWESLDERVEIMRRSSDDLVLTLCTAPDWMKGSSPGATDWNRIEHAPEVGHYADFARLAAAVARRYPDVRTFQVWNELKGFWDTSRSTWNIEAYTQMYNAVYSSLKSVNSAIRVGGPYVPMDSWSVLPQSTMSTEVAGEWGVVDSRALNAIEYWLKNKAGADFLCVDGSSETKDKGLIVSDDRAVAKFVAITKWLRTRTNLPVWWSELYPAVNDAEEPAGSQRRAAIALYALAELAGAGAKAVLLWQPDASASFNSVALYSREQDGSVSTLPIAAGLQWLKRVYAEGRNVSAKWTSQGAVLSDGSRELTVPLDG